MDAGALVLSLVLTGVGFLVLYGVIRSAVASALEEHYRTVRWYEATGEWHGKKPDPRALPSSVPSDEA